MFKKVLASAMTLGLLSASPALALDPPAGASQLINTLRAHGVYVEINPEQVCDAVKSATSYHGVYLYAPKYENAMMGICQDYGGTGDETIWTDNDLDTLRHESIHYIQDCVDNNVDGNMVPIYDGPGGYSPVEYSITDVIAEIGPAKAQAIIDRYEANGASSEVIRLELEAFYLASTQTEETIAKVVEAQCPVE